MNFNRSALVLAAFVVLVIAASASSVSVAIAEGSLDDQQAIREIVAANAEIDSMIRVRAQEVSRNVYGGTGKPSPELEKLMNPASALPKLDDPHVPLHLRFAELWRRDLFVPVIKLAQDTAAIRCEEPELSAEKLLEVEGRAKGMQEIQCWRNKLEHYEFGIHKIYKQHEANIPTLHLPTATQARIVSEAHATTGKQDKNIQSGDETAFERLRICEEFVNFIGAHAAGIHFVGGRIEYDDPAVYKASLEIGERLRAADAAGVGTMP